MVFAELAAFLGLSLPVFHYLVCFLGTIPIGFFHRFIPTVPGRHLYAFASGAILTYLCFKNEVVYLFIPCAMAYLSMALYRKKSGFITFFLTFAFLIYCHVTYMSGDSWKKGNIDFTGALMILSLKVISAAMNYQDGSLPDEDLRDTQKQYRLKHLPTPLEFLGFVFSDGTLLAGPPFEMADYLAYTERKREWSLDRKSWPSPYRAFGGSVLKAVFCMAFYQVVAPRAPLEYFASPEYANSSFLRRVLFQYLVGLVTRWKYYFIWSISECALILSGQGFSGYDKEGKATWTMAKNADILKVELAESAVTLPHYWNIQVGRWLRLYVYERLTKKGRKPGFKELLVTQVVSAVWHGLYPGYLCFFVNAAIMIAGSRILFKYFQALKEAVPQAAPLAYFLHWLYSSLANNYGCIGFVLLFLQDTLAAYRSVYYIGTIVPVSVLLIGKVFPPPRYRPKAEAHVKSVVDVPGGGNHRPEPKKEM